MTDAPDQAAPHVDAEAEPFVDGYLLYLLAAASERASRQFHAQIRKRGVRVPDWRVLATLVDRDGMILTELAVIALLEQSRMTRVIDQMETRGLVRRQTDEADRRRVNISLTEPGRALARDLVAEARAHEFRVLSALTGTDAARIKPVLQTMLRTLNETPSSRE
ncbi:MAG: MarR family transcriptional regulator [Pseudomonadota bacterium]